MKKIYKKYEEIIKYLIFGVLTTVVSIVSYYLLSLLLNLENDVIFVFANVLSWFLAVTFAYLTNKKYVFKSSSSKKIEFVKFILSRLTTLLIEIVGMYVLVKLLMLDNMIAKFMMQVVIIVLNYVFSKIFVFKK